MLNVSMSYYKVTKKLRYTLYVVSFIVFVLSIGFICRKSILRNGHDVVKSPNQPGPWFQPSQALKSGLNTVRSKALPKYTLLF